MFAHSPCKQKRAPKTSATQRLQRPFLAKIRFGLLSRRLLFAVGVALGGAGENLLGDQAGVLADGGFDLGGDVGVRLQERLGVFAALAEALAVIGEPGAGLFDDA